MKIVKTKWHFDFSIKAQKQFEKLDNPTKIRFRDYIIKLINSGKHPRTYGKQLSGTLKDLWSFRVGDYRILARIQDDELVILAVHIAHRREVYDFTP